MPEIKENYHSNEAQEILGKPPVWIVRWGSIIIFAIFLLTFIGCYFIKFPDIVKAPIVVTMAYDSDYQCEQSDTIKQPIVTGKIQIAQINVAKIKKGQVVHVKLVGYPYVEYGMLSGVINKIDLMPKSEKMHDNISYVADVVFVNRTRTTRGNELPVTQQMDGTAEIITKDYRLLERLLQPLISVLQKT